MTAAFPARTWERLSPAELSLEPDVLARLGELLGGSGVVVRYGRLAHAWGAADRPLDVGSAFEPVLSTLLAFALQEGLIGGVDDAVAALEPRLGELNNGKDGAITWRHLASQTSGYGLVEAPGQAWSHNDYALALYSDLLIEGVFAAADKTSALRSRLADPLGFEDPCSLNAYGPRDRPGRLAISVRDFARFGLLMMNKGRWPAAASARYGAPTLMLRPDLVALTLGSPVPASMPASCGREAAMLPGQRTMGGGKGMSELGPGCYSFGWWLNLEVPGRRRLHPSLPASAIQASGHDSRRSLLLLPEQDLVVAWNETRVQRGRDPVVDQAMQLVARAVAAV